MEHLSQPPKYLPMAVHNTYYPTRQADQGIWLRNFRNKLAAYAAALGLSAAQVASILADADWLIYLLGTWLGALRTWAPACTAYLRIMETGKGTPDLPTFATPHPGAAVPVAAGALTRIFALVQIIKLSPGCTAAVAKDLGITGGTPAAVDLSAIQPKISVRLNADHVEIGWGWGGYRNEVDMLEIQVDRADGKGWVLLAFDTTPDYTDTTPHPTVLTAWKYRACFYLNDAPVGKWSSERSVAVGV